VILLIVTFRYNINTSNNINNTDNKFASEMCYDMQIEKQTMGTAVASINTRDITIPEEHHNKYPVIDFLEEYRIDAKPFVNRPFFVESVPWSNQAAYRFLSPNTKRLPRDVFTSNKSLETALKLGAYFRSDLSLSISIAGTISHAGTLLVGILPPFPGKFINDRPYLINSIMSGPHCFLSANEATSCVLHVPWYCNSDVASLDINPVAPITSPAVSDAAEPGDFGTLAMFVLNPLSFSDGASTTLNVTIEACFSSLDIFVPSPKFLSVNYTTQGLGATLTQLCLESCERDLIQDPYIVQGLQSIATAAIDASTSYTKKMVGDAIDVLRTGIAYYTGLHNPNVPLINNRMITTRRNFPNNTTGEQFFEKLDPYPEIDRIVDRPIFNTDVDEMSIKHILSKPQYLGTCNVDVSDNVGTLKWARPISPFQGGLAGIAQYRRSANNLELFHDISRAWRGSLKIHIQSVMNNKQQVKLRLLQLYNPPAEMLKGTPVYADLLSAPSHLLEFTGGGQIQTIDLPYLCRNQLTPCSPDMSTEALFHGMYYIYVAQPLVISSDSPTSVSFNIYMSGGDDLTFHGYATETHVMSPFVVPYLSSKNSEHLETILSKLQTQTPSAQDFTTQGLTVMNEPQKDPVLESYSTSINLDTSHQERIFSPIDIRPSIRRMYQMESIALQSGPNVFKLNKLLGEEITGSITQTPQLIAGMYYGKSAGLKIKLKVRANLDDEDLMVMFAPPQINVDTSTNTFRNSLVSPNHSLGTIISAGGYPFPLIEMSQYSNGGSRMYEFVIPNNSFYKFIGGPQKYATTPVTLGIADFGSLIIWSRSDVTATLYSGFTDESRFGFHCIAPLFSPYTLDNESVTAYKGSTEDGPIQAPRLVPNPFLYYTR
jgi:hypothetical protein